MQSIDQKYNQTFWMIAETTESVQLNVFIDETHRKDDNQI